MKNTKNLFLLIISLMALIIFSTEITITTIRQKNASIDQMNSYLVNLAEKEALVLGNRINEVGQSGRILSEMMCRDTSFDFDYYNNFMKERLTEYSMAFGMGYWFEPYYIDKDTKYFGPYIYKDDSGEEIYTLMYSTPEYDYFSWDWYREAITSTEACHLTEPYYDELMGTYFATYSCKIIRNDQIVGLVTIDITLREFEEYINSIQIGEKGEAFILTRDNIALGDDGAKVNTEDAASGVHTGSEASAFVCSSPDLSGKIISSTVSGSDTLNNYITVWAPIGSTDMHVVFCYPKAELMKEVYQGIFFTIIVFLFSMVLFIYVLNRILKKLIEQPLSNLLNNNRFMAIVDSETDKRIDKQPNFDNMLHLIERLLAERNQSIDKLNEKNDELELKNDEIEGLYQQTAAMNTTLHQLLDEVRSGYIITVKSLSNAIEAKDKYTKGHCERVTAYALETARRFGMNDEELISLEYASILHDVGKIGMPISVLNKPERLSDEEFQMIKAHPKIGYEIIKDIKFLEKSVDIVLHHHERVDGKGYPDGKYGSELNLQTKILTVADAYDAMTSSRPYRTDPLSQDKAIAILREYSGSQFDPDVVAVFIEIQKHQETPDS